LIREKKKFQKRRGIYGSVPYTGGDPKISGFTPERYLGLELHIRCRKAWTHVLKEGIDGENKLR